ncbi:TA system VapC family ribonuclease toxin [Tsukamurella paurometabola]|nr:TA system VapC family ribonuclease toxin [Tsukamurella paurometabola]MBS4102792.1 PIN domain-containing protein [Tsukamurella paurometabola]UEA85024.1 PIN domain-containing protein [Tsukamurella paurometabola]
MSDVELPDVNVLVALLSANHVHHTTARDWFASTPRFATTPITEAGLVRMALNRAVMGTAITAQQALASLASLRADDRAEFVPDESSLAAPSIDLVGLAGHKQVTDLHLVNLMARHSGVLVTLDTRIRPVLTPADQPLVRVLL